MSHVTVTFSTDNDAFAEGDFEDEVSRVLQRVATKIRNGEREGAVLDTNGNRVGTFHVGEEG